MGSHLEQQPCYPFGVKTKFGSMFAYQGSTPLQVGPGKYKLQKATGKQALSTRATLPAWGFGKGKRFPTPEPEIDGEAGLVAFAICADLWFWYCDARPPRENRLLHLAGGQRTCERYGRDSSTPPEAPDAQNGREVFPARYVRAGIQLICAKLAAHFQFSSFACSSPFSPAS